MDATYTVTFKGFAPKAAADLDKWLREDIAYYTKRMAMDNVSVEKAVPKPRRDVPLSVVKAAVKKVKKNGKP